jgi:hypothetical protein
MPGPLEVGGGPDPAGTQCGGPLTGAGGGPDPAGTQWEIPSGSVGVAVPLTVMAVSDPLEGGVPGDE